MPFSPLIPDTFPFLLVLFHSLPSPPPPLLGFSISQTPHHFSRCYDKPWLINSKAGTPLRGFDYSDFQLPSAEVEYGPAAPGPARGRSAALADKSSFLPGFNTFLVIEQRLVAPLTLGLLAFFMGFKLGLKKTPKYIYIYIKHSGLQFPCSSLANRKSDVYPLVLST